MKRFSLLATILTVVMAGRMGARDAPSAPKRANQQYVPFESECDRGMNVTVTYDYLLDNYANPMKVVEVPNNGQYIGGAKSRLKALYPYLLNGTVYYSERGQPAKALDLAAAYIDILQVQLFRSELLSKDNRYAPAVYYAAVSTLNLEKNEQTLRYFQEYLNTGTEAQQKDCYVYINVTYQKQKKYADQGHVLEQIIAKYPVSLDSLYSLVNIHIATNNMEKLIGAINRILAAGPNNDEILPIRVCILERQGENAEALGAYKRLYALRPESFELMTDVARVSFNCATKIVNNGATTTNDAEYTLIRQRASGYLMDVEDPFPKILQKGPSSKSYIQGLADVYQYIDTRPGYEVLSRIVQDRASHTASPSRLAAHKEALRGTEDMAQEQESAPVPMESATLIVEMDQFTDANNNKVIDTGGGFALRLTIKSQDKGDAYSIRIRLTEQQGYDRCFNGPRELDGDNIPAGKSKQYTFRHFAKKELPTSPAKISIYTFEVNGFDADPSELIMNTQEYTIPRLRTADHQFFTSEDTSTALGKSGKLIVVLQNFGIQTACKVKANFTLPENILTTDLPETTIDSIAPGDMAVFDYGFLVNKRFSEDSAAVMLMVTESTRSTFLNEVYKVKVGDYLSSTAPINLNGNVAAQEVSVKNFSLSFKSELIEDAPVGTVNRHRYALIIGNKDYNMAGTNVKTNVPCTVSGTVLFREYCVRTFGVPDGQVKVMPNTTAGAIHEQLDWLVNMANTDPQARLIFYYSGRGNNDEVTKKPYLLPVDITGKNIRPGILLSGLYKKLVTYPIRGAHVFLGVCFNGGYKSAAPLLTQKGVRVASKMGLPQGNTLGFSSSSGDQTSDVYHEKKQRYYMCFLIKTTRDARDNLSVKELLERTSVAVKRATALIDKAQESQCMVFLIWVGRENIKLEILVIEIPQQS